MDFAETIKLLHEERDLLNQAIAVLERVQAGAHHRRRGRPPKWLAQVRGAVDESLAADEVFEQKKRSAQRSAAK